MAAYGLAQEDYDRILAAQGGACGACGGKRAYNLAVDHDHALAETVGVRASVRGALCKRCNKVLRDVRDDRCVLCGLIEYLAEPPARKLLRAMPVRLVSDG